MKCDLLTYYSASYQENLTQFLYGHDKQRRKTSFYNENGLAMEKYFVGLYEKEVEFTEDGIITRHINYITGGDGMTAIVLEEEQGEEEEAETNTYFTYKDHLGSIVALTDEDVNIVIEQSFGACSVTLKFDDVNPSNFLVEQIPMNDRVNREGKYRNPDNWSSSDVPGSPTWLRGYTGHEHLPHFDLINMNGRIYDPILGRMLSSDKYVQDPLFSQSYNRYSYVWNNPLRYTDPSGELIWVPIVAFTVVGAGSGALVASRSGEDVLEGAIRGASLGFMAGLGVAGIASAVAGGGAVAATATAKTAKGKAGFSAKKVAARIYGGLNNTLYNYDNDNSWVSSVGYFAAGFLGTHIGIESHVAYGMLLNGISNQAVALGDNKKDKDGYYFMQKFVGGGLNAFVSVSMYSPEITYMGFKNKALGKSLNYAIQNHASTFAYTDKDVYTEMGGEQFVGLTVAGLASGFINYQISTFNVSGAGKDWKNNTFTALGRSPLVLVTNYYLDYGFNHQKIYGNSYGGFDNYKGKNIKKSSAGAKALNTALQLMIPE